MQRGDADLMARVETGASQLNLYRDLEHAYQNAAYIAAYNLALHAALYDDAASCTFFSCRVINLRERVVGP